MPKPVKTLHNVVTRMEDATGPLNKGPMSILFRAVREKIRIKVTPISRIRGLPQKGPISWTFA